MLLLITHPFLLDNSSATSSSHLDLTPVQSRIKLLSSFESLLLYEAKDNFEVAFGAYTVL